VGGRVRTAARKLCTLGLSKPMPVFEGPFSSGTITTHGEVPKSLISTEISTWACERNLTEHVVFLILYVLSGVFLP